MLSGLLNKAVWAALACAACAVLALWMDGQAKAALLDARASEIESLKTQVAAREADNAAFSVLAQRRPQIERQYGEILAAIHAAGDRTDEACLTDPRVRAFYDGFRLRHPDRATP